MRSMPPGNATIDVGEWLRSLGLGQYEAAFRKNAIDGKVLPKLTAEDLKDLGIVIVGHRRMMLSAIEALSARSEAPAERAERAVPLPQAPPTTPSAATSRSSSATSSVRRAFPPRSTPRTGAISWEPISTRPPRR